MSYRSDWYTWKMADPDIEALKKIEKGEMFLMGACLIKAMMHEKVIYNIF